MWLKVRHTLEDINFHEMFHILVERDLRTYRAACELRYSGGVELHYPNVQTCQPFILDHVRNCQHRI